MPYVQTTIKLNDWNPIILFLIFDAWKMFAYLYFLTLLLVLDANYVPILLDQLLTSSFNDCYSVGGGK